MTRNIGRAKEVMTSITIFFLFFLLYASVDPGFDFRLYLRNFSGSVGSGTCSSQPREDNRVAT